MARVNPFRSFFKVVLPLILVTGLLGALFLNCSSAGFESMSMQGMISGNDPLLTHAWHIKNTGQAVFSSEGSSAGADLNLTATWAQGYLGKGVRILISDDGVEDTHEDLKGNFRYGSSKDYSTSSPYTSYAAGPKTAGDNHGTAVAGLIAAVGDNGLGSRGVAPKAEISVANFLSAGVSQTSATMANQADGSFDVYNMSWGGKQNNLSAIETLYETQLEYGVLNGRGGKGANYIKAAGNEYLTTCHNNIGTCVGNSNFDADNTNPYVMIIGAINAQGLPASYSSAGSNLWISAFGGEYGDDSPAMMTTDRSTCAKGYAASTATSAMNFERGSNGNNGCNYSVNFNGTSAAAPLMSGVVALILEANPLLSWRDVRYILAKTARKVQWGTVSTTHPRKTAIPSGAQWEQPWITNAAGFSFHNRFGFGVVDVDTAVQMAKSFKSTFGSYQQSVWADDSSTISVAIPDNSAVGGQDSMTVASSFKIQSVQLALWVTHPDISHLAVELTSPSGTRSILVNMNNALGGIADYQGEVFLTNAFYQENSVGVWKVKVIDGTSGNSGTLTRWKLNLTGSN